MPKSFVYCDIELFQNTAIISSRFWLTPWLGFTTQNIIGKNANKEFFISKINQIVTKPIKKPNETPQSNLLLLT